MKKVAFVILLVLMVLAISGCGAQMKDYVIKVDGPEGATFDATYMYQVETSPRADKLSGTAPAEIPIQAEVLSCEITKTSAEGTLKITLTANGEKVDEKEITEQGGKAVVSD